MDEIPDFLRRTKPTGETPVTTPAPAKTRKPRQDVYIARLVVRVPIDMANAETLSAAIKAVADIAAGLPAGSTVDHTTKPTFGKM